MPECRFRHLRTTKPLYRLPKGAPPSEPLIHTHFRLRSLEVHDSLPHPGPALQTRAARQNPAARWINSRGAVGDGVTPVRAAGGAADEAEAECIHPAGDEILCEDVAGIGAWRGSDP